MQPSSTGSMRAITEGTFILRIDDTDRERSTAAYEEDILDSLRWLGLDWGEGVGVGGPHGDYRQSSRYERYQQAAADLVASGAAYYDNRSPDELEALRRRAEEEHLHPGHYIRRPENVGRRGCGEAFGPTGPTRGLRGPGPGRDQLRSA